MEHQNEHTKMNQKHKTPTHYLKESDTPSRCRFDVVGEKNPTKTLTTAGKHCHRVTRGHQQEQLRRVVFFVGSARGLPVGSGSRKRVIRTLSSKRLVVSKHSPERRKEVIAAPDLVCSKEKGGAATGGWQ